MTTPQRDGVPASAFSAWMREQSELDSVRRGLSVHNIDWIIHQYKTSCDNNGTRNIQNIMLVEEKAFGAHVGFAQEDTLDAIHELIMRGQKRGEATPAYRRNRGSTIRYFGKHILRFSGAGPVDSDKIWWNGRRITIEQLTGILNFSLNPWTLQPRDVTERRHHSNKRKKSRTLFDEVQHG